MAEAFDIKKFAKGETVVKEGDEGHSVFLISSGSCRYVDIFVARCLVAASGNISRPIVSTAS